ncbi:MAG: cell division protein FtsQ/DivIB [Candidatus Eisenbacteria bacterium]
MSVLSLVVIGLISCGLTFKVTGDVNYAFVLAVEGVTERVTGYLAGIESTVLGPREGGSQRRSPGETWVLITGQGMVMGLDREGYVTWCESASGTGDLPALTGFSPAAGKPGTRLSTPEAVLGLTIVRAFELSPSLMDALSEINLENLEHPRAILTGGTLAELGHGGYVAKVKRLDQILMQARQQNMHVARIDLRFGRQVVVEWNRAPRGFDKEV